MGKPGLSTKPSITNGKTRTIEQMLFQKLQIDRIKSWKTKVYQ